MTDKSIIILIKRALILGLALMLMVSIPGIFFGEAVMAADNNLMMIILSAVAISAFIVLLIWPLFKEAESTFGSGKDDEMFP